MLNCMLECPAIWVPCLQVPLIKSVGYGCLYYSPPFMETAMHAQGYAAIRKKKEESV